MLLMNYYVTQDPEAVKKWERVAEEMRDKLKRASQHSLAEGKMTEADKHKYFMSGIQVTTRTKGCDLKLFDIVCMVDIIT